MPKVELTTKELFWLGHFMAGEDRRHRFGLIGLKTKFYKTIKKLISEKEYNDLKEEWKKTSSDYIPPEKDIEEYLVKDE